MTAYSNVVMIDSYRDGLAVEKSRAEFQGGEMHGAAFHNAATAPARPATGQVYWDTAMGTFRVWNGDEWVTFGIPFRYAWLGSGNANPVDTGHHFGHNTTSLYVAGRLWIPRMTETETTDVWQYEETVDGDGNYQFITPRYKIDLNAPCFLLYLPIPAV